MHFGIAELILLFGAILALVVLGLVIWAVLRIAGGAQGRSGSAEEILRQRYARGEITREQFEQMRDDLRR